MKNVRRYFLPLIKKAALVSVSLFLSLLLIEKVLQTIQYQPKELWWQWDEYEKQKFDIDTHRIWKLNPNRKISEHFGPNPDEYQIHTTDNFGFRTNSFQKHAYTDDVSKIVVLGDSYTYGHAVSDDQAIPSYLQDEVNKHGQDMLVINAGVQGYNPDQEYIYLTEEILPKIKPDVVIWNISFNDLIDMRTHSLHHLQGQSLIRLPGWTNGIYTQGLLHKIFMHLKPELNKSLTANLFFSVLQRVNVVNLLEQSSYELSEEKIERMITALERKHIKLVVTLVPVEWAFNKNYVFENDENLNLWREYFILGKLKKVSPYFLDGNAPLFDIQQQACVNFFLDESYDGSTHEGYRHLSPAGNQEFARALYSYLDIHQFLQKK